MLIASLPTFVSATRPSRRNYLITIWCRSVSGSGDTCEKPLREWLSVPTFIRAFLKSPSSRGLSAIAELLVPLIGVRGPGSLQLQCLAIATFSSFIYFCLLFSSFVLQCCLHIYLLTPSIFILCASEAAMQDIVFSPVRSCVSMSTQ